MGFGDLFDRAAGYDVDADAIVRALADRRAGEQRAEPTDDEHSG
jgi:hypothetical protein